MKLKDIFRTCNRCNASALLAEIGEDGYCCACQEKIRKEQQAEAMRNKMEAIEEAISKYHITSVPDFFGGGTLAYGYRRIPAVAINRAAIEEMALSCDYSLEFQIDGDDVIAVKYGGPVLKMMGKLDMLEDWIRRGDPVCGAINCMISGKETVDIGFYRNLDKWLDGFEYVPGVLTSCMADEKQDVIADLEPGMLLCLDENEKGKTAVFTVYYNFEIGSLPAKLNKYDESEIKAIVVDHLEETIRSNGEEAIIPHVRVYLK